MHVFVCVLHDVFVCVVHDVFVLHDVFVCLVHDVFVVCSAECVCVVATDSSLCDQ